MSFVAIVLMLFTLAGQASAQHDQNPAVAIGAADILGNPEYKAFCYGGYRETTRETAPTVDQIKDDMRILSAMGVKLIRTYNTQQYAQAANLLQAIRQLRQEDPDFEMYVMLGTWIECEKAWTPDRIHTAGNVENNTREINAAVKLANTYPESVKIIAVGNEAMINWATNYFVKPPVILHWVEHLQDLKAKGELPANVWITSSDNYASWGGESSYQTDDLVKLIKAVDYVSLHTYPFHDTYHVPAFWCISDADTDLSAVDRADAAMKRVHAHALAQYNSVADYIQSLGIEKPIHIGETGWASTASDHYGPPGSHAADEYKQKLFYDAMRQWTHRAGITCFYFEAFDEKWKDPWHPDGPENHFGLINLQGQAKYALWDLVDAGAFDGLTRDGKSITKTHDGDQAAILTSILPVPTLREMGALTIDTVNKERKLGQPVTESKYILLHDSLAPDESNDATYPSAPLKTVIWEGTCLMKMPSEKRVHITSGTGEWWGCALQLEGDGKGENLTPYANGNLHIEMKGNPAAAFRLGFQTGLFLAGTQTNNFVMFGPDQKYQLAEQWTSYTLPMADLIQDADMTDVTNPLFLKGDQAPVSYDIEIRNIYYTRE